MRIADDEDEGTDGSSSSDDGDQPEFANGRRGQTYLVDKGRVKILPQGMEEYEALVQRRLAKREKIK